MLDFVSADTFTDKYFSTKKWQNKPFLSVYENFVYILLSQYEQQVIYSCI
jgi:hypothetical protein